MKFRIQLKKRMQKILYSHPLIILGKSGKGHSYYIGKNVLSIIRYDKDGKVIKTVVQPMDTTLEINK